MPDWWILPCYLWISCVWWCLIFYTDDHDIQQVSWYITRRHAQYMMTSSNGNIFRVTGPLCGEFTGPGEFPTQRPVTRSFDVFFDLRMNKRLSKQPWGWWFETLSWSSWRHCNDMPIIYCWLCFNVAWCRPILPISPRVSSQAPVQWFNMVSSSDENIFRVAGHLCGEFTGHRWIPLTKASDAELWCFLWSVSE